MFVDYTGAMSLSVLKFAHQPSLGNLQKAPVVGPRNQLYRTGRSCIQGGLFSFRGPGFLAQRHHGDDLADQFDLEAVRLRAQHDIRDEAVEDDLLEITAANGAAVGAGAAAARRRAGEVVATDRGETTAAVSADIQASQQVPGAPAQYGSGAGGHL